VFGNGIAPMLPDFLGGPLHASLERAVALKRDSGKIKLVCRWTLNRKAAMARYFELGVDGIMTDDVSDLIAAVQESKTPLRLATRSDNPFP
jgi:glycerophosphoryl diester phosphodiesterase